MMRRHRRGGIKPMLRNKQVAGKTGLAESGFKISGIKNKKEKIR